MASLAPPATPSAPIPAIARPRAAAATAPGLVLLFLPAAADGPVRWLRWEGERLWARGDDLAALPDAALDRVVAAAPADAVALHAADLGALAPAQARAAARLLTAEASLGGIDALHVAVGGAAAGERLFAVVAADRMAGWLALLDDAGIEAAAIVPAPLLLPVADEGFTRADLGGETVYRSRSGGFADDPLLTPVLVEARPVSILSGDPLERRLREAAGDPELDLRQGPFARRRRFGIDWPLVRRLAWLALALAGLSLLTGLAGVVRDGLAADAIDREAAAVARAALPRGGAAAADPLVALDRALAGQRGGGVGFTTTAGVLFGAVQATGGVELVSIDFGADGVLRAGVRGPGAPEVEALVERIEAAGFAATPSPFQSAEGRVSGEIRVALP